MVDVLISYRHRDFLKAQIIESTLSSSGLRCWLDRSPSIVNSSSWRAVVSEVIETVKCVVLVVSETTRKSLSISQEIELAKRWEVPILVVLIAGDDRFVPIDVIEKTHIDLRVDLREGLKKLTRSVKKEIDSARFRASRKRDVCPASGMIVASQQLWGGAWPVRSNVLVTSGKAAECTKEALRRGEKVEFHSYQATTSIASVTNAIVHPKRHNAESRGIDQRFDVGLLMLPSQTRLTACDVVLAFDKSNGAHVASFAQRETKEQSAAVKFVDLQVYDNCSAEQNAGSQIVAILVREVEDSSSALDGSPVWDSRGFVLGTFVSNDEGHLLIPISSISEMLI